MLDNWLIQLFHEGKCLEAYKVFGAHFEVCGRRKGVRFTLYAPNARSVQVVGDFNDWDGSNHYMEKYNDGGIYTLFIAGIKEYDVYKYRIETNSYALVDRADPYAFFSELRPASASKVFDIERFRWSDRAWMKSRTKNFDKKLNIYEAHIGSWKMKKDFSEESDGEFYSYEELIDTIIPYVKQMGYTHLEIMPLLEYPFDGSWGYQATGFYSITSRYGSPKQLMKFINACHKQGIGIIIDFPLTHFVKDGHGLYQFDGGFVYDYPDINQRYTQWDSVYFDVGRDEVRSFLMSSVAFLANYFHVDGIRFDAISNLIYWGGDKQRGENDGAIEFMKRMNASMLDYFPNVMLIAEDSSDYENVTNHPSVGGLGFDYKWDLGWMNDTLKYFQLDPIHRHQNHNLITFSMAYFYQENFILPFSHDEVVHSKKTILDKIWGNHEQKFAQLKSLYIYMMMHPGKKLNFMGNELGEYKEWDEKKALGWNILDYPMHQDFNTFIKKLNNIYHDYPCMYEYDYYFDGFEWLVVDDCDQSVFAFERRDSNGQSLITILNFTPNNHVGYRIGVNEAGTYLTILNTNDNKVTEIETIEKESNGKDYYLPVDIDAFGGMILRLK